VRLYTPLSGRADYAAGRLTLLVKSYPGGAMSAELDQLALALAAPGGGPAGGAAGWLGLELSGPRRTSLGPAAPAWRSTEPWPAELGLVAGGTSRRR
jgi:hypothetical protein